VVLGFRPEVVLDARAVEDPSLTQVTGVASSVEFNGPDFTVTVALGVAPVSLKDLPPIGPALRTRFARRQAVRPGEPVAVAVDATRAHVFDALTGSAIWHPVEGMAPYPPDQ
jgi:multiple sugar transport system ATP-binding protein